MTDQMPQVNAEFGTTPVIEFPTPEAPKGLKMCIRDRIRSEHPTEYPTEHRGGNPTVTIDIRCV